MNVAALIEDEIEIREAAKSDLPNIVALVPELVGFGPPPWRDPAQMIRTDVAVISKAVSSNGAHENAVVYVGVLRGRVIAFLHATATVDYYTQTPQAHVADVVVSDEARGAGLGTRLLAAAEEWAKRHGFSQLSIAVFERNAEALKLYQRLGFEREIIRLIKPL